jgi:hypothetical protein
MGIEFFFLITVIFETVSSKEELISKGICGTT